VDHEDPFGRISSDTDGRTVIRPRPGGKGLDSQSSATPAPPSRPAIPPVRLLPRQGANPLESAAAPLLTLLGRLRDAPSHPDPAALRNSVIGEIKVFETKAQDLDIDREAIFWARYVLCASIDEMVLTTPWGNSSIWQQQSLLITLHNEAWGGEKFFQILQKLVQNPGRNIELLELMYLCLSFGFEGRYRPLPDGYQQLQLLRDNLYRTIRNQRGEYEQELSPHWQGIYLKQNPLVQYVPLWVVVAVSGVLLLAIYFGFNLSLNVESDPVYAQLHNIAKNIQHVEARPAQPAPAPAPPTAVTLRTLLAPEIAEGKLTVVEDNAQGTIRINGDGLFASGKSSVKPQILPLLQQIGWALDQIEGEIMVVGHTDNIPIRSLLFPSNWHLSRARAESVKTILAQHVSRPERIKREGRGSAEPLVANDSPQQRARNRRVEITLLKQQTRSN